jgi:hypothetical protein
LLDLILGVYDYRDKKVVSVFVRFSCAASQREVKPIAIKESTKMWYLVALDK